VFFKFVIPAIQYVSKPVHFSPLCRARTRGHHLATVRSLRHRRMAQGDHGLPKVSVRPTMPDLSTPSGLATLQLYQGWPTRRAGGQRLTSSPLDTPRRTPMPSASCSAIGDRANAFPTSTISSSFRGFSESKQHHPQCFHLTSIRLE
jgi:hypothetical protein